MTIRHHDLPRGRTDAAHPCRHSRLNPCHARSTDIDATSGLAQQEFNKFVKQEPVKNEPDGRSIKFSFERFGKPRSHSADPRIMRIVPGLREMLQKAVPIESRAEHNQQKYRNIKAWHSYAARAELDGQPLYVKLTTFETIDGKEIFSLYHDHNITTAEVMKKGLLAGPDLVTNRAVTQEALDNNSLYQWYHQSKQNPPTTPTSATASPPT